MMWSLVSRMLMAVVASFTMTIFIAVTADWALHQSGRNVPLSVLLWILSPTTFLLSSTALEYLEDGNLVRSLRVSLLYTGFAAVLIVVLYAVAALASPRHRIARHPQRPLSATVRAASHIPTYQVWKRQRA